MYGNYISWFQQFWTDFLVTKKSLKMLAFDAASKQFNIYSMISVIPEGGWLYFGIFLKTLRPQRPWALVADDPFHEATAHLRKASPRLARACSTKWFRKELDQSQQLASESKLTTQAPAKDGKGCRSLDTLIIFDVHCMFIACCFKTFQDKTFSLWEFVPLASPCFACRLARWLRVGQKIWLLKGSATALGVSGKESYGKLKLMPFDKASGVWHMDRTCFFFKTLLIVLWWLKQGRNRKGHQGLGWITSQHEGLEPALSQQVSVLQDIAIANPCRPPIPVLRFLRLPSILLPIFYHCTVPYHEDVRLVKDARSSSLQILATGTVASGLSRLVQRCPALILHEGTFFLQWP